MSKILIVQPYRMLQHAFSTALFPDHQVELLEKIPESDNIKGAEVVIIDAGALREQDSLGSRELLAVQNWQIPTLWIDAGESRPAPARENLFTIHDPLTKESLHRALAECLRGFANVQTKADSKPGAAKEHAHRKPDSDAGKKVIELIEVVEEDSSREKS